MSLRGDLLGSFAFGWLQILCIRYLDRLLILLCWFFRGCRLSRFRFFPCHFLCDFLCASFHLFFLLLRLQPPALVLAHGINPLLHRFLTVLHDDLAFVVIDRHVRKSFLVKINQRLLIGVMIWWPNELATESAARHRLKIACRSVDLGDFLVVEFLHHARGPDVSQALFLAHPDGVITLAAVERLLLALKNNMKAVQGSQHQPGQVKNRVCSAGS